MLCYSALLQTVCRNTAGVSAWTALVRCLRSTVRKNASERCMSQFQRKPCVPARFRAKLPLATHLCQAKKAKEKEKARMSLKMTCALKDRVGLGVS